MLIWHSFIASRAVLWDSGVTQAAVSNDIDRNLRAELPYTELRWTERRYRYKPIMSISKRSFISYRMFCSSRAESRLLDAEWGFSSYRGKHHAGYSGFTNCVWTKYTTIHTTGPSYGERAGSYPPDSYSRVSLVKIAIGVGQLDEWSATRGQSSVLRSAQSIKSLLHINDNDYLNLFHIFNSFLLYYLSYFL